MVTTALLNFDGRLFLLQFLEVVRWLNAEIEGKHIHVGYAVVDFTFFDFSSSNSR